VANREQVEVQTNFRAEETAGFCSVCNKIVPRKADASCSEGEHEAERVTGLVPLNADGQLPFQLPKFNWGAALMPPVWGPIHGALSGAIVLPIIIFARNVFQNALDLPDDASMVLRGIVWLITISIMLSTVYFMYFYGRRGYGLAWNKSAISKQPEVTQEMFDSFLKRERLWTALSAILFAGFVFLVINFWL